MKFPHLLLPQNTNRRIPQNVSISLLLEEIKSDGTCSKLLPSNRTSVHQNGLDSAVYVNLRPPNKFTDTNTFEPVADVGQRGQIAASIIHVTTGRPTEIYIKKEGSYFIALFLVESFFRLFLLPILWKFSKSHFSKLSFTKFQYIYSPEGTD